MEIAALPDDLATCHGMICELASSLRADHRQVEQLGHRLDLLLRRLYGPRSERVDPDQLLLFADQAEGDLGTAAPPLLPAESTAPSPTRKSKGHGRKPLPADLPRERRVHEIPPDQRPCPECGLERRRSSTGVSRDSCGGSGPDRSQERGNICLGDEDLAAFPCATDPNVAQPALLTK